MIELPKGERVGPFEIVRRLPRGEGGMAVLYEARLRDKYRTPGAPTRVALKIARADHVDFLKDEANLLRRFDHPGVVRVYPLPGREKEVYVARQTFTTGPSYYIAMEYIGGGSLADYLQRKRHERLSVRQAVQIALQVASALEHIHARGVINLDVKPTNILLRHSWSRRLLGLTPQAVLCDFGIARDMQYPTYGGQAATPAYMSPEQLWGTGRNPVLLDHRSDIYSLGVVLYEMLTGDTPLSATGLIVDDEQAQPPSTRNPRVSTELDTVVMCALAKNREARFQTAREMITALQAIPLPVDWSSLLKRAVAVVALVIGITALTLGLGRAKIHSVIGSTPTITVVPTPTIARTWTPSPTATCIPCTPTSTPLRATSTPVPTYTSTPTRTPTPAYTPTYTPTPQ